MFRFLSNFILYYCLLISNLTAHEWTDKNTGRTLEARLINIVNGKIQILREADKRRFELNSEQLKREDIDYAIETMSQFNEGVPEFSDGWSSLWWKVKEPKSWNKEYDRILSGLTQIWSDEQTRKYIKQDDFFDWVLHLTWIKFYTDVLGDSSNSEAWIEDFKQLGQMPYLVRTFLDSLHPSDNHSMAYEILRKLYKNNTEGVEKYPKLAVAISIVFDQPFPRNWPHHQVHQSSLPTPRAEAHSIFDHYAKSADQNDLHYNPNELSVMELKFMIDHLLPEEEILWARKYVKEKIGRFDRVFSSIKYDRPRLTLQQYNWPYEDYKLASIQARGGICVDQAYFAAMSGKAKGIPTLYFSGQGADGGHAWFGYLRREGKWITDCGQYENQNYPVGHARDPQTWEKISDSQLKQMADAAGRNKQQIKMKRMLAWASHVKNEAFYHDILLEARRILPDNIEVWKLEAEYLERNASTNERIQFYENWANNFNREPELKAYAQEQLISIHSSMGDSQKVEMIRAEMLRDNKNGRFDLGIRVAAKILSEKLDAQDWSNAENEFKKIIRKFDDDGGGNLFYKIVRPYFNECLKANKIDLAKDALKYATNKMDVSNGSILYQEFTELQNRLKNAESSH